MESTANTTSALVVVLLLAVLCGCAPQVYKEAATDYVHSAKDVQNEIGAASKALATAQNTTRERQMLEDSKCPLEQPRIFVRIQNSHHITIPNDSFVLGKRFGEVAASDDCKRLFTCEGGSAEAVCQQRCYTAAEGQCIALIDMRFAALTAPGQHPDALTQAQADAVAARIHAIEYGPTETLQDQVIGGAIAALGGYLKVLQSLADDDTSDAVATAKQVSDDVAKSTNGYTAITGNKLSATEAARRDQLIGTITAIGKFAQDLGVLADGNRKAADIKKLVREEHFDEKFDVVLKQARQLVQVESQAAQNLLTIDTRKMREMTAQRFRTAKTPWERQDALDELAKYPYDNQPNRAADINKVFEALDSSHKALVSLVEDPTDEQKRQIAMTSFSNFLMVAEDVAGVLHQIK